LNQPFVTTRRFSSQAEAPAIEKLSQELEVLKAKKTQADQDVTLFIANAEKEKQGTAGSGLTGVRGCKKRYAMQKNGLSQASDRKDDSIRLGKEIVALEGQNQSAQRKNCQPINRSQTSLKKNNARKNATN